MKRPVARLFFFVPASIGANPVPPEGAAGRAVALREGLLSDRRSYILETSMGTLADSRPCGGAYLRNTARVRPCNIGNSLGAAV